MARICAWISEYDSRHRFNPEMQSRIKQEYAYHAVRASATGTGPNGPALRSWTTVRSKW